MSTIGILIVMFLVGLVSIVFNKSIAKHQTRQYAERLRRLNRPEVEITTEVQKMEKTMMLILYLVGFFFSGISLVLLAMEFFYPFSEVGTGMESAETGTFASTWKFIGLLILLAIILRVLVCRNREPFGILSKPMV